MDEKLRILVAKVITTKGCSCCESRNHQGFLNELAAALAVPRYKDDSGYNWYSLLGHDDDE